MRQRLSFNIGIVAFCLLFLVKVCHSQQETHLSEVINKSRSTPIKLKQFKRDPAPVNESKHDNDIKTTKTSTASKKKTLPKEESNTKTTQSITPSPSISKEDTHSTSEMNTLTSTDTSTITHKSSDNENSSITSSKSIKSNVKSTEMNSRSTSLVKKTTAKSITITRSLPKTKLPFSKISSSTTTSHKKNSRLTSTINYHKSILTTDGYSSNSRSTSTHSSSRIIFTTKTSSGARGSITTTNTTPTTASTSEISASTSRFEFGSLSHHETDDGKSLSKSDAVSATVTQKYYSDGIKNRSVSTGLSSVLTRSSDSSYVTPSHSSSSIDGPLASHSHKIHDSSSSSSESTTASSTFLSVTTDNKTVSITSSSISDFTESMTTAMSSGYETSNSVAGPTPKPTATLNYNNNSTSVSGTPTETSSIGNTTASENTTLTPTATERDVSSSGTMILTNTYAMSSGLSSSFSSEFNVESSTTPSATPTNNSTLALNNVSTSSPTETIISGRVYTMINTAFPNSNDSSAPSSGYITSFSNLDATPTPILTNTDYMTMTNSNATASSSISQSVTVSQSAESTFPTSGTLPKDETNNNITSTLPSNNTTSFSNQTNNATITELTAMYPTRTSSIFSHTTETSGSYTTSSTGAIPSVVNVTATPTDTSTKLTTSSLNTDDSTSTPETTTTDNPTTVTTTQYTIFSPNSVYQYETLPWLSEPFSYNTHRYKKTQTPTPTSTTTSSSHNDSKDDSNSNDSSKSDKGIDTEKNNGNDDYESNITSKSSSSGGSKTVKTTENKSQTSSNPEYITPNINAIIPETSSIAYLRFHTLSYNTLVSDSLLTAQFVQDLPAMISRALDISPNDVIFLTITSEKNSDNIKSLFKRGKKGGVITALAIPTIEMDELNQLVQSKNSSLYLPVNKQIVSLLDRSYPITGSSVTLNDPNGSTQTSNSTDSNKGKSSGLPTNALIGICVGVGVAVYASATIIGINIYKKRKQQDRKEVIHSISSPMMQSNSLGWQVYPPENQFFKA